MSGDLRSIVRDVLLTASVVDPQSLTKEVAARIDPRDLDDMLSQALPYAVRELMRGHTTDLPDGQTPPETHPSRAVGQSNRSSKVVGIREAWRRHLRDVINVGPSDYKRLGDCTADDLDYAADLRDRMARANADAAQRYRSLADALREHGVDTVASLPDLADRLGDAA